GASRQAKPGNNGVCKPLSIEETDAMKHLTAAARKFFADKEAMKQIEEEMSEIPGGDVGHDEEDHRAYREELNERPKPSEYKGGNHEAHHSHRSRADRHPFGSGHYNVYGLSQHDREGNGGTQSPRRV